MADRIHKEVSHEDAPEPEPAPAPVAPSTAAQGLDEVLDGIDDVLEVNALSFVQRFGQKSGE